MLYVDQVGAFLQAAYFSIMFRMYYVLPMMMFVVGIAKRSSLFGWNFHRRTRAEQHSVKRYQKVCSRNRHLLHESEKPASAACNTCRLRRKKVREPNLILHVDHFLIHLSAMVSILVHSASRMTLIVLIQPSLGDAVLHRGIFDILKHVWRCSKYFWARSYPERPL